mmetsp:Transcript_21125/g.37587  ORF Transcript_21125/g.37587 Transcript_21125/m.37587 type:complete len:391 (-) Transcript_21125:15-1187(-)
MLKTAELMSDYFDLHHRCLSHFPKFAFTTQIPLRLAAKGMELCGNNNKYWDNDASIVCSKYLEAFLSLFSKHRKGPYMYPKTETEEDRKIQQDQKGPAPVSPPAPETKTMEEKGPLGKERKGPVHASLSTSFLRESNLSVNPNRSNVPLLSQKRANDIYELFKNELGKPVVAAYINKIAYEKGPKWKELHWRISMNLMQLYGLHWFTEAVDSAGVAAVRKVYKKVKRQEKKTGHEHNAVEDGHTSPKHHIEHTSAKVVEAFINKFKAKQTTQHLSANFLKTKLKLDIDSFQNLEHAHPEMSPSRHKTDHELRIEKAISLKPHSLPNLIKRESERVKRRKVVSDSLEKRGHRGARRSVVSMRVESPDSQAGEDRWNEFETMTDVDAMKERP